MALRRRVRANETNIGEMLQQIEPRKEFMIRLGTREDVPKTYGAVVDRFEA